MEAARSPHRPYQLQVDVADSERRDADGADTEAPDGGPRWQAFPNRRFLVVAAALALLIPVTWLARIAYIDRVEAGVQDLQRSAATEALNEIEGRFHEMQDDLLRRARRVAEASAVVRGLRERDRHDLQEGPIGVVEYFAELDIPLQTSVELYDVPRRLVAWKGFSMPLDAAPAASDLFDSFQTAIASDVNLRQALVVWWPVRDGRRVLGVVRVMHLIGYDAPVQNEYVRDVSLAARWQRMTRLPVEVSFEQGEAAGEVEGGRSQQLQGEDGKILGRVVVEPPAPDQIVAEAQARFDDLTALWTTLLLFWLMGGVSLVTKRLLILARHGRYSTWMLSAWFVGASIAWWGLRYALLDLDVPARWQDGRAPLAPLFDPVHFASGLGGGLLRSTGDFLITSIFLLVFAAACARFANVFRLRSGVMLRRHQHLQRDGLQRLTLLKAVAAVMASGLLIEGLTIALAMAARRAVFDSTFDYFGRQGLLPDVLLLIVLCSLILATIGIILTSVAVVWIAISRVLRGWSSHGVRWTFWAAVILAAIIPTVLLYAVIPLEDVVSFPVSLSFLAVSVAVAVFLMLRQESEMDLLILRSVLPAIFMVTVILYPMLYNGMDAKRRMEMTDVADTFAEGRDPRVLFAMEQILREMRFDRTVRSIYAGEMDEAALDSIALANLRGSLLSALPAFDVSLTFIDSTGRAIGRYYDTGQSRDSEALDEINTLEFSILHQMYVEGGASGVMVEQVTGRREPERFQYEGIAPVYDSGGARTIGWIMARAEPEPMLRQGGTPFPRVLLPAGAYDNLYANLSIAEFRDGILVRSMGRDFGRYRLDDDVGLALAAEPDMWRTDRVEERTFETYYRRQQAQIDMEKARPMLPAVSASILAVRVPGINTFDHLYYLLRLTVCGLIVSLPLYLLGLLLRYHAGMLPAPRVRFRDKVLNAFLGVGIISVAAVGFVGLEVVTDENERAVQTWLRQNLERVEETLALDARGEEMPFRVLDRVRIDSLAARVGLDLILYRDHQLVALSRPQLYRERLIDQRIPIEAFKALHFDGYRFIYTDERVGNFTYTTGFRALPDEQGRPQYVVSVPTLPEQERFEEERARTVAYLFGSLLLLVLVVMLTASLLANAISRPVARLRSGLQAVAAGRFERMIPVDSRDEIGELVQTFNEMQEQLAESRRKLAQQERQLAWREMARQVAHEIKNPLTPMKLSVQHLRRAFEDEDSEIKERGKFADLFSRITSTLIEQIDTLARIANEFHSFARMPSRIVERLDLNAVVEEAVALMQEESDVVIQTDLCTEKLMLDGDREELRRDFINLIKNGIQAIPEERKGRIRVRTRLEVADDGSRWAFCEVNDNGTGVEEEVRDRIFEPNFSTKTSGTGLGLAIVTKSVEEHRGEIGFDTTPGEGSTFWVRLPLAAENGNTVA